MPSRFAVLWNRLPVSRKIFFSGIIFLACFSLFGEGMEHMVSDTLYGTGQMLSDSENMVVWFCCIMFSASIGCSVIAYVIKLLADGFTGVIRRLASGDRKARISGRLTGRMDEIGLVAKAFNGMAERLEQEDEREKMLLASVSHELRSPLTRMSVALELLRIQSGDSPQADRIAAEIDRMQSLVKSILDYSR
ncbi:MAG: HAMP domain-containing histidine kinase, partial [Mailhella sp.]|nr:HAMP domain-containing histidine kinase [Mailhella sp.]